MEAPARRRGRPLRSLDPNESRLSSFAAEIRRLRHEEAGMSQQEFADRIGYSRGYVGQIERAEKLPDTLFVARSEQALGNGETLRLLYDAAEAEQEERHRVVHMSRRSAEPATNENEGELPTFWVASNQFIPLFCPRTAEAIRRSPVAGSHGNPPLEFAAIRLDDGLVVHATPFGVVTIHRRDVLEMSSLTDLAVWERRTYNERIASTHDEITAEFGVTCNRPNCHATYALSVYAVMSSAWALPSRIDAALALMSMASVLLSSTPDSADYDAADELERARAAEQAYLSRGITHPEIMPLGMSNTSLGYASWDAITYYALSPARALSEQDIIDFEVKVQTAFCYCYNLLGGTIEPEMLREHAVSTLQACMAQLLVSGLRESTQYFLMREAIIRTSRLESLLRHAQQALQLQTMHDPRLAPQ